MMAYWHQVENAAGMGGQYHWALVAGVVAAFALSAAAPAARPRLRAAVFLIAVSFVGMLLCGLLLYRNAENTAAFPYVHFTSELLFAMAVIDLAGSSRLQFSATRSWDWPTSWQPSRFWAVTAST